MVSGCKAGGGRAASDSQEYRHPLIARINPLLGCLDAAADPSSGRRVRWTPRAAALAAVLMGLGAADPLGVRCEDALGAMASDFVGARRVGGTYNGLLKALERQHKTALPMLKSDLRRQAFGMLERVGRTEGWVLLGVDGTKEELARTADNERGFGVGDNGAVPQAFATVVVEVHTGLAWDWRIGPACASEKGHLVQMAADLPEGVLLLADGNFVGYPVWSELNKQGKSFLIRVGGNVSLIRDLWPSVAWRRERGLVHVWPQGRQGSAAPLTLRLIRVGSGRRAVHLLSNVLDPGRLSAEAAGAIYRLRWGVELFYRTLKRTLGMAKLRSRCARRARLELEWGLIAMTVMTLLGIGALAAHGREVRRLSPALLVRGMRRALPGRVDAAAAWTLERDLSSAVRDSYRRKARKQSRHRPITKNTPRPHRLKPPRLRRATAKERRLALEKYPHLAA